MRSKGARPAPTPGDGATTSPETRKAPSLDVSTLDSFVTYLRSDSKTRRTISLRAYYTDRAGREIPGFPHVVTDDLRAWIGAQDWSANTRKSAVASLRVFFDWAVDHGIVASNPAARLKPQPPRVGTPRPAPSAVIAAALDRSTSRDRLMIALAAFAGLRREEIASLQWSAIQWDGLRINGKGGRIRQVPLLPRLRALLDAEAQLRSQGKWGDGWRYSIDPSSPYVFPGSRDGHMTGDRIARIIRTAMDDSWSPHTLRHRFATKAYAVERDLLTVQRLLGHSSPETTAIYTAPPMGAAMRAVEGSALMDDAA